MNRLPERQALIIDSTIDLKTQKSSNLRQNLPPLTKSPNKRQNLDRQVSFEIGMISLDNQSVVRDRKASLK